jgi:hypothetical protein
MAHAVHHRGQRHGETRAVAQAHGLEGGQRMVLRDDGVDALPGRREKLDLGEADRLEDQREVGAVVGERRSAAARSRTRTPKLTPGCSRR